MTCVYILSVFPANAQLNEKVKELIKTNTHIENQDPAVETDSLSAIQEKHRQDSIKMEELTLQIQEMKLNEILLRSELDKALSDVVLDSLRKEEKRQSIDSLRQLTPGVPVIVDSDTLFLLYAKHGGLTPQKRAENINNTILQIGTDYSFTIDSVYVLASENLSDIMYGDKVVASINDNDALWQNCTRDELAHQYVPVIAHQIEKLKKEHSVLLVAKRIGLFLLVIVLQIILWRLTNFLFRKLRRRIIWFMHNKLKPITIREYEFLDTHKQGRILLFFSNILRYAVILAQLAISIPILFAIFPQTEELALQLFTYVFNPVKMVLGSIIRYIPNLFIILVIYFCIKYLIKAIQYIANEIQNEKLKITGFYPDWALPTFNIVRFLLYVFMIAMIYPYLPGSDSGVFQGISVFVGIIVSLGSSSAIANIIAGLVITYMRPFRIGDRIKLNDTEGNVIEKTPFVTRLRTPKNEIVTIPNSSIMSSHTVNYSASAQEYGLIIHTDVTFGYEIPWRQVHELLIEAAKNTKGVMSHPKPFVLETQLHDYYTVYQINAYIKDADKLAQIYSDLMQNIQDKSNEAGIELLSPHYYAKREAEPVVLPPEYQDRKSK